MKFRLSNLIAHSKKRRQRKFRTKVFCSWILLNRYVVDFFCWKILEILLSKFLPGQHFFIALIQKRISHTPRHSKERLMCPWPQVSSSRVSASDRSKFSKFYILLFSMVKWWWERSEQLELDYFQGNLFYASFYIRSWLLWRTSFVMNNPHYWCTFASWIQHLRWVCGVGSSRRFNR